MRSSWRLNNVDLKRYQPLLFQASLIVVLIICLVLVNIEYGEKQVVEEVTIHELEEVVELAPVVRTEQSEQPNRPPPPMRPLVPVEVPNDQVIDDMVVIADITLDIENPIDLPQQNADVSSSEGSENNQGLSEYLPPDIDKGAEMIRSCIRYPPRARSAGIEGRVLVNFVINQQGRVENPAVILGSGYGMDEETLRCVRLGDFSRDGNPVARTHLQYMHDFILRGGR